MELTCGEKDMLPNGTCRIPNGQAVLDQYGFSVDSIAKNFGILVALFIGWRIVAFGVLVLRMRASAK